MDVVRPASLSQVGLILKQFLVMAKTKHYSNQYVEIYIECQLRFVMMEISMIIGAVSQIALDK